MAEGPLELSLELAPRARFDVVELRSRLPVEYRDALAPYPYCLYWSAHTTAGFLDRRFIARLGPDRVPTYVDALRRIFPEGGATRTTGSSSGWTSMRPVAPSSRGTRTPTCSSWRRGSGRA